MRTREVLTGARKALVTVVAAAFVVALTAAPAHAAGVEKVRDVESAMGIYEQMPMREIIDAVEAMEGQEDEPAEPGEDVECPDPDIGDGGDWEPGPDPDIGDGGDWEPGPEQQFPEGDGSDGGPVPEVPQGGNEETPTDTPEGGQEETPTVPSGSNEDTPTQTTTEKPQGGSLPFTGGNGTALAVVGLGVILGGLAMLAMRRERGTER